MSVEIARVTHEPLSVDDHLAAVASPACGATAMFVGTVRDHDPSVPGAVTHLDYSAHPDAQATIERLAAEAASAHPGVRIAITHRMGLLAVGEAAVVAAAAAPHRAEAFAACRDLIERAKAELPVWKREILADGSHTWVGL